MRHLSCQCAPSAQNCARLIAHALRRWRFTNLIMLNRFAPFAGAVLWKIGASLLCSSGSKAASFACGPLFEVSPVLEVAEAKCQPLTVLYMCTGFDHAEPIRPKAFRHVVHRRFVFLCSLPPFLLVVISLPRQLHQHQARIHGFRMHSASLLPAWRCVPDRLLTGHLLAG